MYEHDYMMRLIHEILRMLLKIIFHIDLDSPIKELVSETKMKTTLEQYLDLVDRGEINEAENQVWAQADGKNQESLAVALLFYSYLNDKEDSFLEKHGFSRKEIKSGVKTITQRYGLSGMTELMLFDE